MIEFITGAVVGFVIAAIIGRGKFLQVQNKLRELNDKYIRERNLSAGLEQELADRTR